MPLASNPGQRQSRPPSASAMLRSSSSSAHHYATPKDRSQASALGPNFMSATASRATSRMGAPGAAAVRGHKWARAWRLPMNEKAHQVLCLKRVPERFAAIALQPLGEYSLFDKFRRAVMRTWSAIVQHEPALQDTPSTSWVALGMHWAFPHNSLLCLEASMHVLANMMPIRPDAEIPPAVINTVVALIETKRASLTAKWRRMRIDPSEIISPLIKNLGVPIFGETLWPSVFGACCVGGDDSAISIAPSSVLEPSSSLLLYVAALLLMRAPLAEKARSRERVFSAHNALFQQDGGEHTLRSVCHVMSKFVRDLIPQMVLLGPDLPRLEMVDFTEDDDYYPPLLNPEDEPERLLRVSVPEFLDAIEKNELELAKRGIAKQRAHSNAGEAIAWSRALQVQEPNAQLEIMERELARRNNQKGYMMRLSSSSQPLSSSAASAASTNAQTELENVQNVNQFQRQHNDRFVGDTRYVSPNIQQQGQQQHAHILPQAMSSLAHQSKSTTSIHRNGPSSKTASTLIQTSIPKVMERSSATKPPSSVAAVLEAQQHHTFPNNQINQNNNAGVPSPSSSYRNNILQTPSSSSNPTGMVNSPPKPMAPPFSAAAAQQSSNYFDMTMNQQQHHQQQQQQQLPRRGTVQVSSGRQQNSDRRANNEDQHSGMMHVIDESNHYNNDHLQPREASVGFEAGTSNATMMMKTPFHQYQQQQQRQNNNNSNNTIGRNTSATVANNSSSLRTPATGILRGSAAANTTMRNTRPTSAHRPATVSRPTANTSTTARASSTFLKKQQLSDPRGRRRFFDATSFLDEDNYSYPYSTTTPSTRSSY